jgi:hypothetical protein
MSAQERFSIIGWADEVIGETARQVDGRVWVFGSIIGETNFLEHVSLRYKCIHSSLTAIPGGKFLQGYQERHWSLAS